MLCGRHLLKYTKDDLLSFASDTIVSTNDYDTLAYDDDDVFISTPCTFIFIIEKCPFRKALTNKLCKVWA